MVKTIVITILCSAIVILGMSQRTFTQSQSADIDGMRSAVKLLEIGKTDDRTISTKVTDLFSSLDRKKWNSQSSEFEMLVIYYGTDHEIAKRKKVVLNVFEKTRLHHTKITFVYGGVCKAVSTVFWQVPRGAEMPEICAKPK